MNHVTQNQNHDDKKTTGSSHQADASSGTDDKKTTTSAKGNDMANDDKKQAGSANKQNDADEKKSAGSAKNAKEQDDDSSDVGEGLDMKAANFVDEVRGVAQIVFDRLVEEAKERPRVALGIAAGIGFALGGALWTRAGRTILLTGVEYAALRIASNNS